MKTPISLRPLLLRLILSACVAHAGAAVAQTGADDVVLISNSRAKVTRADYNAELLKLAPELRAGFANNPRRVNDLLVRMLVQKSLAAQARAAKLDASPEAALRVQLEVDRLLAQFMVESVEATASAEFDANSSRYEARAKELYTVERARFATPDQVSATHVLFDVKKRGAEEAKRLAQEARAKILAGSDMGKLAYEQSDDPSAKRNNGALGWFAKKEMDPAFGDAAFALGNPGDVSLPVLSEFGWHVIRLDGKRSPSVKPYDEVRETIMAELKKRYIDDKRDEAVNAIRRDPATQLNREAVGALSPRVDLDAAVRAVDAPAAGAASPPPK
jgi:peptidyl-prolyl cis-trans isomerase C